jgi:hypothetical protein
MMKSAYGCTHVKSVTAWALFHDGKHAGNVVANYSDNPNGSNVTCTVNFFSGPLAFLPSTTGKAGGGGYCKFSAAFDDAITRAVKSGHADTPDDTANLRALKVPELHGRGAATCRQWLESVGYVVASVIGPS